MDAWLDALVGTLTELMTQNLWFAPALSLVAGIVTSFTPCSLSAVPMVIAYMEGSSAKDSRKALRLSLVMALGMAVTFGIFGSAASLIGHVMHDVSHWWSFLMGILMILMALQMWGVIRIFPGGHSHEHGGECDHSHGAGESCSCEHDGEWGHSCEHGEVCDHSPEEKNGRHFHLEESCPDCGTRRTKRGGYLGAFFTGALGGVFASHCAAPVMVALLAMVAQSEHTPLWGIFLMVLYALGHSILMVFAGTSYSVVDGWIKNPRYAKASRGLKGIVGAVILLIGLLMLFA